VKRYVSEPIDNPAREGQPPFQRADLIFYGVDHSGPSFEARVYFNDDQVDESTDREPRSFAGSFTVSATPVAPVTRGTATSRRVRVTRLTGGHRTL
jgi:hypothetical protein